MAQALRQQAAVALDFVPHKLSGGIAEDCFCLRAWHRQQRKQHDTADLDCR